MSGDIDDEGPAPAPVTMPAGYDAWKLATPSEFETMGPPPWLPPDAGPERGPVAWAEVDALRRRFLPKEKP